MTDPDPCYAGGPTPWGRYDVPALAGFLDEDLSSGWAQVLAWAEARDVTAAHLDVMRRARETIVRAWPPSVNAAARAFVDQVDALISSMEAMVSAADSNGQALSGILTTLTEAKKTVDGLHEQWKVEPPAWESVLDAVAPLGGLAKQQVVQERRAQLNTAAQKVMQATDNAVYEYMPQLVVVPKARHDVMSGSVDVLPPPSGTGRRSAGTGSIRPVAIPSAAPPASVPPRIDGGSPILTAGTTANHTTPGTTTAPEPSPPVAGQGSVPAAPGFWVDTPAGRVLRPGAVLGEPLDARYPASSGTRPYGATNQGPPDESGQLEPGQLEPGMWGGLAGGGRSGGRRRERTLPSDTEWAVPKGVPPVLEPGPEPVHDPGPGVIGIDR